MSKTVYRRIFPPAFLQAAADRKVDIGAYLPPDRMDAGVCVGQTAEQYSNAVGLCSLLQNEYECRGKDYRWIDRAMEVLMDPPGTEDATNQKSPERKGGTT